MNKHMFIKVIEEYELEKQDEDEYYTLRDQLLQKLNQLSEDDIPVASSSTGGIGGYEKSSTK